MVRVAICDDDNTFLELIENVVKDTFVKEEAEYEVDSYNSGQQIIDALAEKRYDLILLDICMPEVSGFDVAQQIHNITKGDNLIFVSSEEQLVYQTFDFRPLGFVRKHELDKELSNALSKWYHQCGKYLNDVLQLDIVQEMTSVTVKLTEVMYIESYLHYVYVYTETSEYKVRGKISDYEYLTERKDFARLNVSCICNFNHAKKVNLNSVKLYNGKEVSISRALKKSVQEKYSIFLRMQFIK